MVLLLASLLPITAITTPPGNGNLVNNVNGTFTYTGNLNFVGADSFTYTVNDDGGLTSADITVNVNVVNVNDAPTGSTLVVGYHPSLGPNLDIQITLYDSEGVELASSNPPGTSRILLPINATAAPWPS